MAHSFEHIPVLRDEVVSLFASVPSGVVVDATVGGGGHAAALLEAYDALRIVGLDRDPAALEALPTLVEHGRADEMIEIARGRASVESLRALKVPLTYREYDCGHEITAEGLNDLSNFLTEKVLEPIVGV